MFYHHQLFCKHRVHHLAHKGWPNAATKTRFSFLGSIASPPTCCTLSNPTCVHVLPASVDLYMPLPTERSGRSNPSPLPTYNTFGLDGETTISPIEPIG